MQNKISLKLLVGGFMLVSCLRMANASEVTGTLSSSGSSNQNATTTITGNNNTPTGGGGGGFVIPNLYGNPANAQPGVVLGATTYNPAPNPAPVYYPKTQTNNLNPIVRKSSSGNLAQVVPTASNTASVATTTDTTDTTITNNDLAIADTAAPAEFSFLGFGIVSWMIIIILLALVLGFYLYNNYENQNSERRY